MRNERAMACCALLTLASASPAPRRTCCPAAVTRRSSRRTWTDVGHRGRPQTDGALEHILAEGVLALLLGGGLAALGTVGAEQLRVIARGSGSGDDGEHQRCPPVVGLSAQIAAQVAQQLARGAGPQRPHRLAQLGEVGARVVFDPRAQLAAASARRRRRTRWRSRRASPPRPTPPGASAGWRDGSRGVLEPVAAQSAAR